MAEDRYLHFILKIKTHEVNVHEQGVAFSSLAVGRCWLIVDNVLHRVGRCRWVVEWVAGNVLYKVGRRRYFLLLIECC